MKIGGILSFFNVSFDEVISMESTGTWLSDSFISVLVVISSKLKVLVSWRTVKRFGDENIFGVFCGGFMLRGVRGERKPSSSSGEFFLFVRFNFILSGGTFCAGCLDIFLVNMADVIIKWLLWYGTERQCVCER